MDFLYSAALLISLIAGCTGLLLGLTIIVSARSRSALSTAAMFSVRLATVCLAVSVLVHWFWGHSPASPEPMTLNPFVYAHPAFLVAGATIGIGLMLTMYARRKLPEATD